MKMSGKPDAGNLHVRFDEGDQRCTSGPYSTDLRRRQSPMALLKSTKTQNQNARGETRTRKTRRSGDFENFSRPGTGVTCEHK